MTSFNKYENNDLCFLLVLVKNYSFTFKDHKLNKNN